MYTLYGLPYCRIRHLPEKDAAAAKIHRLLETHKAITGEAVPSTVTKRHLLRPTTSLSLPNMGHETNASNLAK